MVAVKHELTVLMVAAWLVAGVSHAQDGRAEFEVVRSQVKAERQAVVARNLPLGDVEADRFWPLYREYQDARDQIVDRRIRELEKFYDNFDDLTEEQAKQLLQDYADIQADTVNMKKAFIRKFRKVLTSKQTLRFFQIEHRMDAITEEELSQVVPLAQ